MDGQDISEQARPMLPFLDWVKVQPAALYDAVLVHVQTISAVLEGVEMVQFAGTSLIVPNYWAMADAARALRELATLSGFPEAATFCQQTYETACEGMREASEQFNQAVAN